MQPLVVEGISHEMITTSEFRNGLAILVDHELCAIVEHQHVKPGKGGAFMRTKLRRLKDGSVMERTFRVGEKFEEAFIEERKLQFLYRSGTSFHFMNMGSFEDVALEESAIDKAAGFLKENMEIVGDFHDGRLVGLELPVFIDLRVEHTEPGIRGDTSRAGTKPAQLETGMTIQVPLFVGSGETVRVDTRTGEYVSRA